jgi:hypothetical protein
LPWIGAGANLAQDGRQIGHVPLGLVERRPAVKKNMPEFHQ